MRIRILQGVEEAKKAVGTAVVIDVFRAFSLECYLFASGAERILPVGAVETAKQLKEAHPEYTLIGERHGKIIPGFDLGNSPAQMVMSMIKDKTVVHTTSAGTQGIVAASIGADEVLTGSLVNARAVANYIFKKNPDEVSIICMGVRGVEQSPEDTLCGEYIKSLLTGGTVNMEEELKAIRNHKEGKKFFDPELQDIFPAKDFEMCTDVDRFDMVLKAVKIDDDVYETVWNTEGERVKYGRRKKDRRKMPMFIVIIFIILLCIALYFPLSILVKRIILYNECSNIEEYRTREIVNDPNDYNLDVNRLVVRLCIDYFGKEETYHLYVFDDGRVFTGRIHSYSQWGDHVLAIEDHNNETVWDNVEMVYFGKMSGDELYRVRTLRDKADFMTKYYDVEAEYVNCYGGDETEFPVKNKTVEVDPWITAFAYKDGRNYFFFRQAEDGIRHYLYDKNANKMLCFIEDSWYFDQWMTDNYGADWNTKVKLYKTEDELVHPLAK